MTEQPEICCLILIASASVEVRRRWKKVLCKDFPITLAATRSQLDRKLRTFCPSILFIDLNLIETDIRKSLLAQQRLSSATKIIVLTSTPNQTTEIIALQSGASGYCRTDLSPPLIKRIVQLTQKGEIWFSRSIIPVFLRKLMNSGEHRLTSQRVDSKKLEALTVRQRQVAHQIANGFTNKRIADTLNITEATVKAHVTIIFRKLNVSDRLELALFVRDRATNIPIHNQ